MKKILVAVDGSPRERGVLDAGLELARSTGASVVLLKVVGIPIAVPLEAFAMAPVDLQILLEKTAKEDLDRLAQTIPAERRDKTLAVTGTAWDRICSVAKDEDVETIVIGSHGYGGVDRILGTTAAKVVNHADRSVLVVRERPVSSAR